MDRKLLKVIVAVDASFYDEGIQHNSMIIYAGDEEDACALIFKEIMDNEDVHLWENGTMHGSKELWHWITEIVHIWTPRVVSGFRSY